MLGLSIYLKELPYRRSVLDLSLYS